MEARAGPQVCFRRRFAGAEIAKVARKFLQFVQQNAYRLTVNHAPTSGWALTSGSDDARTAAEAHRVRKNAVFRNSY